jgi:hypothetical protein
MSIAAKKLATSTTSRCSRRQELADEWFKENDPGGVAFGYEVIEE